MARHVVSYRTCGLALVTLFPRPAGGPLVPTTCRRAFRGQAGPIHSAVGTWPGGLHAPWNLKSWRGDDRLAAEPHNGDQQDTKEKKGDSVTKKRGKGGTARDNEEGKKGETERDKEEE